MMDHEDTPISRREYAERSARMLYPAPKDQSLRDLVARLWDRELARNYTASGTRQEPKAE